MTFRVFDRPTCVDCGSPLCEREESIAVIPEHVRDRRDRDRRDEDIARACAAIRLCQQRARCNNREAL